MESVVHALTASAAYSGMVETALRRLQGREVVIFTDADGDWTTANSIALIQLLEQCPLDPVAKKRFQFEVLLGSQGDGQRLQAIIPLIPTAALMAGLPIKPQPPMDWEE